MKSLEIIREYDSSVFLWFGLFCSGETWSLLAVDSIIEKPVEQIKDLCRDLKAYNELVK